MAAIEERSGRLSHPFPLARQATKARPRQGLGEEAESKAAQVDYLLMRLKQRLIELPPGIDIVEFVQFDGKPPADVQEVPPNRGNSRLPDFRDRYLCDAPRFARRPHHRGDRAALQAPDRRPRRAVPDPRVEAGRPARLRGPPGQSQGHERQAAECGHHQEGDRHSADGLELGGEDGAGRGPVPVSRPALPQSDEKPPFRTIDEIERRIAAGGITAAQTEELWESLYLRTPEIADLLDYAREHAAHPWIYPLICMAAHTGARRSELIRMLVTDVDFEGGSVTIREKKRVKGKRSTRQAPLTPLLKEALRAWLAVHPGGNTLFCHAGPSSGARNAAAPPATKAGRGGQRRWPAAGDGAGAAADADASGRSPPGNATTISAARSAAESGRSCGACTSCGTLLRRAWRRQESISGLSMTSSATSALSQLKVRVGGFPQKEDDVGDKGGSP